jgi:AraC-like DNA-binding protein
LSALTGYSYDYFRHIFKVAYGISPQDYLINVRLEQAKSMLHNTALSCTQIAISCGFSNSGQMSVMIKRRYGKSPLALRKAD